METMTREEMIRQAKETRKKVTNASVSEAEKQKYPVKMQKLEVPTREGKAEVYFSCPKKGEHEEVLIINFHGGGFIRERTPNDELFCRKINHIIGCKILDVDYKIAPDYPYPAAANESYDVIRWAFDHCSEFGVDAGKIILMGHSAGGNLVTAAMMRANKENTFRPLAIVVEYPPLDLYTDPAEKPKRGNGIPAERARLYNLYYCDRKYQKDPYASPVYATDKELENFPPTLCITGGLDDLCTEAEQLALRLAQAGNEVTLKRFQNSGHAFTIYRKDEYEEAMALIVKYIKNHINNYE